MADVKAKDIRPIFQKIAEKRSCKSMKFCWNIRVQIQGSGPGFRSNPSFVSIVCFLLSSFFIFWNVLDNSLISIKWFIQ